MTGIAFSPGKCCKCDDDEHPPPCTPCIDGGSSITAISITDDLGTYEFFLYDGTNATFAGTDLALFSSAWFPTTTWITAVHQFNSDRITPPGEIDGVCYRAGHLYYAYGLSCNGDGTVKLVLYLPAYIACDGLDSGFPRVAVWYKFFDEEDNFVFVSMDRDVAIDDITCDDTEATFVATYTDPGTVDGTDFVSMFVHTATVAITFSP